jgi:ActR/RegA family two-component response regulator
MKKIIMFIDDDATVLDSVAPNIISFVKERVNQVMEFQSIAEVEEYMANQKDCIPVLAIVDLWYNDFDTNTSDQEGGFKIIEKLRKKFPNVYIIVFSAHLNADRLGRLKAKYPGIPILSKSEGSLDGLFVKIDEGLKSCEL